MTLPEKVNSALSHAGSSLSYDGRGIVRRVVTVATVVTIAVGSGCSQFSGLYKLSRLRAPIVRRELSEMAIKDLAESVERARERGDTIALRKRVSWYLQADRPDLARIPAEYLRNLDTKMGGKALQRIYTYRR